GDEMGMGLHLRRGGLGVAEAEEQVQQREKRVACLSLGTREPDPLDELGVGVERVAEDRRAVLVGGVGEAERLRHGGLYRHRTQLRPRRGRYNLASTSCAACSPERTAPSM